MKLILHNRDYPARLKFMKNIQNEISKVESSLKKRQIPLSRLLELSGVNRSTFYRWKSGENQPVYSSWNGFCEAAVKLGVNK